MKAIFWLLFVCLNLWILFVFSKKFDRPVLIKGFILSIPAACIVSLLIAVSLRVVGFHPTAGSFDVFIATFFSFIILAMINLFNQLFHYMVDSITSFHQKNNISNLNRQPIKFFVNNPNMLKRAASIVWFLGSALMLYGVWLGAK